MKGPAGRPKNWDTAVQGGVFRKAKAAVNAEGVSGPCTPWQNEDCRRAERSTDLKRTPIHAIKFALSVEELALRARLHRLLSQFSPQAFDSLLVNYVDFEVTTRWIE